jgi:ferrochelatase
MVNLYSSKRKVKHKTPSGKIGILLANLGTPDAPTPQALRTYLKEFLSDKRVIELPKLKWWFILNAIVLRLRPKQSAKLYASVWTDEGSPLLSMSYKQIAKVKANLKNTYSDNIVVELGMRYGNPSMDKALDSLRQQGAIKIIVLPLYPQYAGATVGSTFDALAESIKKWRWVPTLHFISGYHKHPKYIDALTNTINEHIAQHGKPEKLIFSYHGIPKRYFENGDPYSCLCSKTTRLVIEKLGLTEDEYIMTFQSRFGKEPWIEPYTDKTIEQLAKDGIKYIAVICPGFSVDCLETIEEINVENRKYFESNGGKSYHYIKALNDRDDHIEALTEIVAPYLSL